MTPVQAAFKEYRKKLGKAPEDPNWVPDVNSVTFLHFQAGWEAKPHQFYQECKVPRDAMVIQFEPEEDSDLL
jgi:hypothetical protein